MLAAMPPEASSGTLKCFFYAVEVLVAFASLVVPSHIIIINLPKKYEKLHC